MFSDESNDRITKRRVLYYIKLSKEARKRLLRWRQLTKKGRI